MIRQNTRRSKTFISRRPEELSRQRTREKSWIDCFKCRIVSQTENLFV
jgi:hypothetical protein